MLTVYAAKNREGYKFYEERSNSDLVSVYSLIKAEEVKIEIPRTWNKWDKLKLELYLDKRLINFKFA